MTVFVLVYFVNAFREQRGYKDDLRNKQRRELSLNACGWLTLAWALHYLPFYFMGRILYFHHYFPALLFSSMLTGVVLDYLLHSIMNIFPKILATSLHLIFIGLIYSSLIYSFYLFSPLAYGMFEGSSENENSTVRGLKWLETWEF
ncbi:Protein O-mannosyl-transferase 2 [Armadillidium vulgare]|nr:Protein O-mannosyl-transferase 2 [Armadillidium vulgare]